MQQGQGKWGRQRTAKPAVGGNLEKPPRNRASPGHNQACPPVSWLPRPPRGQQAPFQNGRPLRACEQSLPCGSK